MKLVLASEKAHLEAITAYRSAVRAGDLVRAERWLRCAERLYRLKEHGRRDARIWMDERRVVASVRAEEERRIAETRAWARQLRAAEHRKRLAAIEGTPLPRQSSEP